MTKDNRPKIGLALGSGGARGLAHIGVLKALLENGIAIDYIAGSSIGALVGGFYAAGLDAPKLEEIAFDNTWRKMFALVDPNFKLGLIAGDKVKAFIETHVKNALIEECRVPFTAVATDLKTGEIVTLDKGEITEAIRASISIPLFFKPAKIGKQLLADGGLSAPVPVEIVRKMGADIVIAVNLDQHYYEEKWRPNLIDIANNSLDILRHHLASANCATADIVINIDSGKNYWYEFANSQGNIAIGEAATKTIMPSLQKLIKEKSQTHVMRYLRHLVE